MTIALVLRKAGREVTTSTHYILIRLVHSCKTQQETWNSLALASSYKPDHATVVHQKHACSSSTLILAFLDEDQRVSQFSYCQHASVELVFISSDYQYQMSVVFYAHPWFALQDYLTDRHSSEQKAAIPFNIHNSANFTDTGQEIS